MKNSLLVIFLFLCATHIQAQKKIKGNGNMIVIEKTIESYEAVNFSGAFDYVLVSGTAGTITISGEENLLSYVTTEVKNGVLMVKTQNRINIQPSVNKTILITVPFEKLNSVSLNGSGDVWNKNQIITSHFKTFVNGSGDIKLNVEADAIEANVTGSGDVILSGKTHSLKVNVIGSGDFKGYNLVANDADVSVQGSGDAKIFCNGHLKARVNGSGDIIYKGAPNKEDSKVVGSGSIRSVF